MRFTLTDVIRHPRFLRAWWIEFPPRRLDFYRRGHPEYAERRPIGTVVLGVLLVFSMLLTVYLTVLLMTEGP